MGHVDRPQGDGQSYSNVKSDIQHFRTPAGEDIADCLIPVQTLVEYGYLKQRSSYPNMRWVLIYGRTLLSKYGRSY
jgi:hypothetical protein